MLITESRLRELIQGMLSEAPAPITSSIKQGKGGYEYEIFSNGKIQIMKKGGVPVATPIVLNPAQAVAVAKEQIAMGNKGGIVDSIANGSLVFNAASQAVGSANAAGSSTPSSGAVTSSIKQGKGGYEYEIFSNGKIQILKTKGGKPVPAPIVLSQAQAVAVAKEQIAMGNKGSVVAAIAAGTLVFDPAATPAGSTNPSMLQAMADFLSSIASKLTVDSLCAPNAIPLWVYPFMNFLVLRKTPLVLTNEIYLQSLHRICDIARARGSASLAGPGDIATAQDRDPAYAADKQGIVGADVSFAKDWSKGYDYTSTNPYMHIAMSLTNFSFSGPAGGPYTITDTYDFNEPGKVTAPLGNPNFMLQQSVARSQFLKTVAQTFKAKGIFAGIEELMRYYEATLNYGGFQITGKTVVPPGYKPPAAKATKK